MAKTSKKVRTGRCYEDSCVRYVIIYTYDKTVQGHRVYCLVSGVNVLLQEKVQRVTPTYPVQVSTVVTLSLGRSCMFGCHFHSCGDLLEFI